VGFVTLIVPALTALRVVALESPLSFCQIIGEIPPALLTEPGPTDLPVLFQPTPALIPPLFAL
jgi:hypothetical protein